MPSDFRTELSGKTMTAVEKLLSKSEDATSFKLARPLQLNNAQGTEVISLPRDTVITVWDRMKGSYRRTSSNSEWKRMTFFTKTLQVTIDRDNIADVKYFENVTTRREVSRQLLKV